MLNWWWTLNEQKAYVNKFGLKALHFSLGWLVCQQDGAETTKQIPTKLGWKSLGPEYRLYNLMTSFVSRFSTISLISQATRKALSREHTFAKGRNSPLSQSSPNLKNCVTFFHGGILVEMNISEWKYIKKEMLKLVSCFNQHHGHIHQRSFPTTGNKRNLSAHSMQR